MTMTKELGLHAIWTRAAILCVAAVCATAIAMEAIPDHDNLNEGYSRGRADAYHRCLEFRDTDGD